MNDMLEFFLGSLVVGSFMEVYPHHDGLHPYEPYRSMGHYYLMAALQRGSVQRCHYDVEGQRFFFTVVGCPEYGVLELSEFDTPVAAA